MARVLPIIFMSALLFPTIVFAAPSALVPASGQNLCYGEAGEVVPCPGTGQDGETRIGAVPASPRFIDSNGTIVDTLTDLVWMKNADCFGTLGWQTALDQARTLASGRCGLTDGSTAGQWRLPNRKEILSLTDFQQADGGAWLRSFGFTNAVNHWYWTSDSYRQAPATKWVYHPAGALWPDSNQAIVPREFRALYVRDLYSAVSVTASVAGAHGRIASASSLNAPVGSVASFTLTPDPGYEPAASAEGTCPPGVLTGMVYTTGTLTSSCSLAVSFIPLTYTISTAVTPSGAGSISCAPGTTVDPNTAAFCTITPAAGFRITGVTIDGVQQPVTSGAGFTHGFGAMTMDHAIAATFAVDPLAEVVMAYRHVLGKIQLSEADVSRLDVAPLGVDGKPQPDGVVGVGDVVLMLRRIVGIGNW